MKKMITAALTALILSGSAAAFAQTAAAPSADQGQAAVDTLNGMSPQQKQQTVKSGLDQLQNMSPEQLAQFKAMYDNMTPEQKKEMNAQIQQQLDNDPQLKADAEKKLQSLTPAQQQQLGQ